MTSSAKHWLPKGLPPPLSVPSPGEPVSRSLYLSLIEAKLRGLIQADPKAARAALEMSQESAPELWAIAEQQPQSQWASALVRSDQFSSLLPTNWSGAEVQPEPTSLQEVLELLA